MLFQRRFPKEGHPARAVSSSNLWGFVGLGHATLAGHGDLASEVWGSVMQGRMAAALSGMKPAKLNEGTINFTMLDGMNVWWCRRLVLQRLAKDCLCDWLRQPTARDITASPETTNTPHRSSGFSSMLSVPVTSAQRSSGSQH